MAGTAVKGVGLVVAATLAFATADVTTKHLTALYAVPLVVAVRYVVNLLLIAVVMGPGEGRALWRTRRTGLVLLRSGCLAVASLAMGFALRTLPVGETIAIIYLSPFAVLVLAGPLLGEKVTAAGWVGAAVGFAGILLILRPGAGLEATGVLYALITAVATVAYYLLTRLLARTETTAALMFYSALVGTVVFAVMALGALGGLMPGVADLGLMVVLGTMSTLGHFLFTAAYREAPASLLAPVNYLHLVWAAILGWLVFGHFPEGLSLIGMALVVLAGAWIALRAHMAGPLTVAVVE